jgi:transcriptional regulator with XRE-family HTH domain
MEQQKKTPYEIAVMEKIKDLRVQKGYSQSDLADILGVSRGFIGQVESLGSASTYNLNHLNRMAIEWKCSPADFLPNAIKEKNWK